MILKNKIGWRLIIIWVLGGFTTASYSTFGFGTIYITVTTISTVACYNLYLNIIQEIEEGKLLGGKQ